LESMRYLFNQCSQQIAQIQRHALCDRDTLAAVRMVCI
jgi:hypothetical protein